MPFTPPTWADGPEGNTPVTAAQLDKLGSQYQAVVDDMATLAAPPEHSHDAADITSGTFDPARLGSGTPDASKVLRGDGVWAAAGATSAFLLPKSGGRIAPATRATATGTTAYASGAGYGMPFWIGAPMSIDALAARVVTSETGMTFRILLYASDADGHPVSLVANSGSISAAATGAVEGAFSPVALAAGLHWGFIRSNAGTTVRFQAATSTLLGPIVSGAGALNANGAGLSADVGTFASPTPTLTSWTYGDSTGTLTPYITIRRA